MAYSSPQNETTVLTLASALTDTSVLNGSTAFDNSSNKDAWGVAELDFAADTDLSAANDNPVVYLYLIPSYDGTNYGSDGDTSNKVVPNEYLIGTFEFNKESGSRRAVLSGFSLGPIKYTATIVNGLGVSVPSGATVKIKSFDRA